MTVNTNDIANGAVTTSKIADGAVTDAKITGTISASKVSPTGLNADTVDGKHASDLAPTIHTHNQSDVSGLIDVLAGKADINHNHDDRYQQKYAKVAVVAQSGGDYTDPLAAMNNLSTWCGIPSATNPCLLKIMPGVYNIGANTLQMQQYVDTEGSGENTTIITGNISYTNGVVSGASNSEIRFVKVENTGGGMYSVAIGNNNASPKITNVTAACSGSTWTTYCILNYGGSPIMTNVTATASGLFSYLHCAIANSSSSPVMINVTAKALDGNANTGILNTNSSPTMINVTVEATGGNYSIGVDNSGGIVKIDHSVIKGSNYTIRNSTYLEATVYVGNTRLEGGINGTVKCIGAYDGNYDPLGSNCQ